MTDKTTGIRINHDDAELLELLRLWPRIERADLRAALLDIARLTAGERPMAFGLASILVAWDLLDQPARKRVTHAALDEIEPTDD